MFKEVEFLSKKLEETAQDQFIDLSSLVRSEGIKDSLYIEKVFEENEDGYFSGYLIYFKWKSMKQIVRKIGINQVTQCERRKSAYTIVNETNLKIIEQKRENHNVTK